MRRRHDDWINATHILKAAGFDKPARTRILERDVQKDVHEKIQGGYGKYQGMRNLESLFVASPVWLHSNLQLQAHGSRLNLARPWRSATASTTACGPYSSSCPVRRHRRRLPDTRPNPRHSRPDRRHQPPNGVPANRRRRRRRLRPVPSRAPHSPRQARP